MYLLLARQKPYLFAYEATRGEGYSLTLAIRGRAAG